MSAEQTIERVARALCAEAEERAGVAWLREEMGFETVKKWVDTYWSNYRSSAVAAIGAMQAEADA